MAVRFLVCILLLTATTSIHAQEPKASASSASGQYELGLSYLIGTGSTRSETEAIKFIRASAEKGYAPAQVTMGYFYENGELVLSDPQQAVSWYKKAAAQDDKIGLLSLGRMYYTGTFVSRDLDEAAKWLRRSADLGEPLSQLYVGLIREEKDYSLSDAAGWYRKSAEQGVAQAQQKLATLLDQGRGVNHDPVEAYIWCLIAFDSGYSQVANQLSKLESDIGNTKAIAAKQKAIAMEQEIADRQNALGCFDWPSRRNEFPGAPPPKYQRNCKR
jgi:TPR repeat protein